MVKSDSETNPKGMDIVSKELNLTAESVSGKSLDQMDILKFSLAVMGAVGNTLSAIVWADERRVSCSAMLLLCLALYDLVYLVGVTISIMLHFCSFANLPLDPVDIQIAIHSLSIVYSSALCGSSLMTVALTAERYVAVALPLKISSVCSRGRVGHVVTAILTLCIVHAVLYAMYVFLVVVPYLQQAQVFTNQTARGNTSAQEDMFISWSFVSEYDLPVLVVQCSTVYAFPWLSILTLNILLLHKLRKSEFGAKLRSTARLEAEKRLVASVMAVCVLPILTHPVGFAGLMLPLILQDQVPASSKYLFETWNILKLINCGANFLFYSIISAQFRQKLLQKLKCCPCKARSASQT